MKSIRLFEQDYYKRVTAQYYKELDKISKLVLQPFLKRDYVIERAQDAGKFLQSMLVKGYEHDKENLLKEQQNLISQANEKAEQLADENPSRELLRRQDYRLELVNADPVELIKIGENMLLKEKVISKYDYLLFRKAAKSEKGNGTLSKLVRKLECLTPENVAKNSSEYKETETALLQMIQIKPDMLWLDTGNDDFMPVNYRDDLLTTAKKAE